MAQDVEQVKIELESTFSEKFCEGPYFQLYCQIGAHLSDVKKCEAGLVQLEVLLKSIVDFRLIEISNSINISHGKYFTVDNLLLLLQDARSQREERTLIIEDIDFTFCSQILFRKLLSSALGAWEKANGFEVPPDDKTDILFGNPGKLFNEQLGKGRAFKDLGAGPEHGEFSHRIQWFLIGHGLKIENTGNVYKDIKRWISKEALPALNGGVGGRRYLWEYLFDRDGVPSNANSVAFKAESDDFRGPSNLNHYLRGEAVAPRYPLLNRSLRERFAKRKLNGPTIDYLLKKAPKDPALLELNDAISIRQELQQIDKLFNGLFVRRTRSETSIEWAKSK